MVKLHWDEQNTFQHFGRAGLKMLIGYDSSFKNNLFEFDNFAKEKTIDTLKNELPEFICKKKEIQFDNLKNTIINETPATINLIKKSLSESIESGEIVVKSHDGISRRHKYTTIKNDDIIRWTGRRQTKLF